MHFHLRDRLCVCVCVCVCVFRIFSGQNCDKLAISNLRTAGGLKNISN
jgi:hypothetical protein